MAQVLGSPHYTMGGWDIESTRENKSEFLNVFVFKKSVKFC